MKKKIAHILKGREKKITDTETVLQPLPHADFRFANPFIVVHHVKPEYISPGKKMRIHPHPHRGFAPVTFMLQGEGYHKDSAGHSHTVKAGDVQWMFAGKGLLHSEGPTQEFLDKGGYYELIQLWINVPAKNKADEPFYRFAGGKDLQPLPAAQGVDLRLASGSYNGLKGPIENYTEVISITGTMKAGSQTTLTAKPGYWTLLYIAHGNAQVNGSEIAEHHLLVFDKEGDTIDIEAGADVKLLYLSAEPIDEPVAAKDNYVMNTQEEIQQAMDDYKNGLFGSLDF